MKRLLLKIAFTLCLLIVSIWALDLFYGSYLRSNKNTKADYVLNAKINADILIHGPCEPLWMINPSQLDSLTGYKSYNLALSHSDFADNYLHLYLYLKNNKAPKLILLYVTPESMDKNFNTFNSYRFAQYLYDDSVKDVIKDCDQNFSKTINLPLIKYTFYNKLVNFNAIQGYKHRISCRQKPFFENGFEPPAKIIWDNHLEDMQEQYPSGYEFKIDSLRLKYLNKIIELAQKHGSKIILYESPVLDESLMNLKNRNQILDKINKTATEKKTKYVVFKNKKISGSRNYYISSLNLNERGLRIFNDSLGKFILQELR